MSITYKVVLGRKALRLRGGNRNVEIRITQQRRQVYLVTDVNVALHQWNEDADPQLFNWVRKSHPHAKVLNGRVRLLLEEVQTLVLSATAYTAEQIKDLVAAKFNLGRSAPVVHVLPGAAEKASSLSTEDFLIYFAKEIERRRPGGHPRSVEKLASILHKVRTYVAAPRELTQSDADRAAELAGQRLSFAALTARWLRDYAAYLATLGNRDSTINSELTFIKTIVRRAMEDGCLTEAQNPFRQLRLHEPAPAPKVKLSQAQIAILEAAVFPLPTRGLRRYSGEQLAREVWLLQYFLLGTRVGDVLTLRWRNVGTEAVSFCEHKTNKPKVAPRHTRLDAVLARLAQFCPHQPPHPDDFVIPVMDAQALYARYPIGLDWQMLARLPEHREIWLLLLRRIESLTARINTGLKSLVALVGLEGQVLTTHSARHSFANAGRVSGMPAAHMRDLLNHHSVAQTETYFGQLEQNEASAWALKLYE